MASSLPKFQTLITVGVRLSHAFIVVTLSGRGVSRSGAQAFRKYRLFLSKGMPVTLLCSFPEELAEGKEFDIRDLERFHRVDQYAAMFIQHGQFGSEFDQERALRVFQAAMRWRNTQNVYGRGDSDPISSCFEMMPCRCFNQ